VRALRASRIGCAPGVLGPRPLRGLPPSIAAARLSLPQVLHRGYTVAKMSQPAARALTSRFALRLCAAARRRCSRCCARSPCSPLRGSRPSIVQRCCAALLARFAGGRSCAAVAAPSPRCAGRGRRCGAVAPLVPASRVVARSRRCCGSPSGSVPYVNVRTRVSLSVPGVHVSTRPSTSVSTSRRGPYPSNITIFFTPPTPLKRGWVPIEHPLNQDLDIGGR